MTLKHFFYAATALVLASACRTEPAPLKVGFSQCSDDEWRQQLNSEFSREMLFHPDVRYEIKSAEDCNEIQIAHIEEFIKERVDLLVVSPNEAEAITPVIEKAFDSGIPVVLVDRKINSDKYTAYVGADNLELGYRGGSMSQLLSLKERKYWRLKVWSLPPRLWKGTAVSYGQCRKPDAVATRLMLTGLPTEPPQPSADISGMAAVRM